MRKMAAVLVALVLVAVVASQLALPSLLEGRVEGRLERDGGTAHVSLSAFPALRLLAHHGDSLRVQGHGLHLPLEPGGGHLLDRLDGFDQVAVRLDTLTAGPLDVSSFDLARPRGSDEYRVRLNGTTTPREVAHFLGSRTAGALGALAGDLAAGTLPGGGATPVPLKVDAAVESHDGRVAVVSANGSIAGFPTGPLTGLVVGAVVRRL